MQVDNDDNTQMGKLTAGAGGCLSSSAHPRHHSRQHHHHHHISTNPQHDCMSPLIATLPKPTTAGTRTNNARGVNLSLGFSNGGNGSAEGIASAVSHQSNLTCCTLFGSGGHGNGNGGGGGNGSGEDNNRPLTYLQHLCGASSQRTDNSYPPQGQGLAVSGLGQGQDPLRTAPRAEGGGFTGRSI